MSTAIAHGENINGQNVVIVEPVGKTIREWFAELPDGYREQALDNYEKYKFSHGINNGTKGSMNFAIGDAFHWDRTPQGEYYWGSVSRHYSAGTPLPKLWQPPTPTPYTPTVEDAISEIAQKIQEMQADIATILALLKPKSIDSDLHTID